MSDGLEAAQHREAIERLEKQQAKQKEVILQLSTVLVNLYAELPSEQRAKVRPDIDELLLKLTRMVGYP